MEVSDEAVNRHYGAVFGAMSAIDAAIIDINKLRAQLNTMRSSISYILEEYELLVNNPWVYPSTKSNRRG